MGECVVTWVCGWKWRQLLSNLRSPLTETTHFTSSILLRAEISLGSILSENRSGVWVFLWLSVFDLLKLRFNIRLMLQFQSALKVSGSHDFQTIKITALFELFNILSVCLLDGITERTLQQSSTIYKISDLQVFPVQHSLFYTKEWEIATEIWTLPEM